LNAGRGAFDPELIASLFLLGPARREAGSDTGADAPEPPESRDGPDT
jgi:hypothetical protein